MKRFRRLRKTPALRRLVRETAVSAADLIYPIFVTETAAEPEEIPSMPGISRFPLSRLYEELSRVQESGIGGVMLFGIPAHKDEQGSGAYDDMGIVQRALRLMKRDFPELVAIADVCLCEYTSHGHCGLLSGETVDNDKTLPLLAKAAVSLAKAGADIIAPSDMMDGRIGYIRSALDKAGLCDIPIMAYSAKFASCYYSPFRDAADSAPAFGDRRSYQMDPANGREAMREIEADIEEGADIVMVKPALAYLDLVRRARDLFTLPLAVYNVSGEYALVKSAAELGRIDERAVVMENLTAMKRAGADIIITYHALDAAKWMND